MSLYNIEQKLLKNILEFRIKKCWKKNFQVDTSHLAARFSGTSDELFEDCEKLTLYSVLHRTAKWIGPTKRRRSPCIVGIGTISRTCLLVLAMRSDILNVHTLRLSLTVKYRVWIITLSVFNQVFGVDIYRRWPRSSSIVYGNVTLLILSLFGEFRKGLKTPIAVEHYNKH